MGQPLSFFPGKFVPLDSHNFPLGHPHSSEHLALSKIRIGLENKAQVEAKWVVSCLSQLNVHKTLQYLLVIFADER